MQRASFICAALGVGVFFSCAAPGSFVNQEYRRGAVAYRVGQLPAAWQRVSARDQNLVFRHREAGTVAVNATCPHDEDAPLHVLTNHLLFGIEAQKEKGRTPITLDGRAALRTRLSGELDGVVIEMDLVVLKKDGCAYDLQLIASPQRFAARQPDFDGFLLGFTTSGSADSEMGRKDAGSRK